jgi:hypothetical protein
MNAKITTQPVWFGGFRVGCGTAPALGMNGSESR